MKKNLSIILVLTAILSLTNALNEFYASNYEHDAYHANLNLNVNINANVNANANTYTLEESVDEFIKNSPNNNGTNWAVIVAGSNTYYNYRHQADVCHAYHILRNKGFTDDNIIVMMYDDIAYNSLNPLQGVIINRNCGCNVYRGVVKDYTGDEVTPENFLTVLKGISVDDRKVLKSGPNDNVFVFFSDHGAYNLIAFPNSYLYGQMLNETLWYMYNNKMYSRLMFYLESCESGSMFDQYIDPVMNIWAISASTPDESSYACEYIEELGTYVGDCWSMAWMQNSKMIRTNAETLEDQFMVMTRKTDMSTPCKYGNMNMSKMKVADFLSDNSRTDIEEYEIETDCNCYMTDYRSVSSRDVVLDVAKRRGDVAEIQRETESRKMYDDMFSWCDLDTLMSDKFDRKSVNNDQYKELMDNHVQKYGMFSDYGLKYTRCLAYLTIPVRN
jgi:glycosylphosphatidylinositol transamidase (GPIT) subunit GPI8